MNTGQQTHSWKEALTVYAKPKVIGMLFLGFSAGLPFLLVFSTLGTWLADANVSRTTIGFFSWIGITYSIKVFWAPVVDRAHLPILKKLFGQRRSWLLLAQSGIVVGLLLLAFASPANNLQLFAIYALLVAFFSATQDIVIDAYRIEAIESEYQAAMSATYIFGYKIGTLFAGAGALYMADYINWSLTYLIMAISMSIGIITTLVIREPEHRIKASTLAQEEQLISKVEQHLHARGRLQSFIDWFTAAVIAPFSEFFKRNGHLALIILILIASYRITDITMAAMANPFYLDMGFSKSEIASIAKLFAVIFSLTGTALGGILVLRYGILPILFSGGILVILTNLLFAWLSQIGYDMTMLAVVIGADSLAGGIATTAFIAYLSSLTNTAYTATQYALFSSLMTLFPKIIAGFSGVVVDGFGYFTFYIYSSLLGLPALLIILYLMRHSSKKM